MKFYYWIRRILLFAGILNILFSISFVICASIVIANFVNNLNNNFSALATDSNRTPINIDYASSFIGARGYQEFFGTPLWGLSAAWQLFYPFFIITICSYLTQQLLNVCLFFFSLKAKNNLFLKATIINFFSLFCGFLVSLAVWNKTKIEIKHHFLKRQENKFLKIKK